MRADEDGHLSVEHDVFGAVTCFGPFQLAQADATLWDLIAGGRLSSSGLLRPGQGMPEESLLGFALSGQSSLLNVQLWTSETREDIPISSLLDELDRFDRKNTRAENQPCAS